MSATAPFVFLLPPSQALFCTDTGSQFQPMEAQDDATYDIIFGMAFRTSSPPAHHVFLPSC